MSPDDIIDETLEDLARKANVSLAIQAISARVAASEMQRVLVAQQAENQRWTGWALD